MQWRFEIISQGIEVMKEEIMKSHYPFQGTRLAGRPGTRPRQRAVAVLGLCSRCNWRRVVGVAFTAVMLAVAGKAAAQSGGSLSNRFAGLWVGDVTITKVSQPGNLTNPDEPQATAQPFQFRLLAHVDQHGNALLLQKVLQVWQEGTLRPAPDGSTNLVVDRPGRFVLVTDERLATNFAGAALRDGQSVGRRFSSAAFGFRSPIPMAQAGGFGSNTAIVTAIVPLPHDDPLNPFVHRYHPDHDNLSDRSGSDGRPMQLPVMSDARGTFTAESFSVTRQLTLTFADPDAANLALPGMGDTRLTGAYRERIAGLHKRDLFIEGDFQLYRASPVAVLNQ